MQHLMKELFYNRSERNLLMSNQMCYFILVSVIVLWRPLSVILGSDKQALYVADDNEIRSLYPGMQNWIYEQAFQGDVNVRIDAMDLHIKSKRIFWTNWHTGRISSFEQPSAGPASPNSNRNRRQMDSRVTDLEVSASPWHDSTSESMSSLSLVSVLIHGFITQTVLTLYLNVRVILVN